MIQELLQKFYYIPVIVWLSILVKYRRLFRIQFNSLKQGYQKEKMLFIPLAVVMLPLVVLGLVLPFAYDEAFTFNHFSSVGLKESLTTYPAPNNHIFHSLLTAITWKVFGFTHAELAVRLPALLFSAFTLYFVFTRYLAGRLYAVVLFGILYLFSPNIIEYAFQARGYSIQICCAVIAYYYAGRNKGGENMSFTEKLNLVLLFLVIGLFTSPAFLYPAICIYLIFITVNYHGISKEFKDFLLINIFYGLTILLLYTPVIVNEGLQKITGNDFVAPVGWFNTERLFSYLNNLAGYITLPSGLGFVVIILFILNSIKQKAFYNAYLLVVPVLMMYALKQLPFERIFLPIGILMLINACMAITETEWFNKVTLISPKFAAFFLIAASAVLSYFYFDQYHKKGDLAYAYRFKKVRSYVDDSEKVYTKNLGWDLGEILNADLGLKKTVFNEIDTAHIKEYDTRSAIFISNHPLPGHKVIDSTNDFSNKPMLIMSADN